MVEFGTSYTFRGWVRTWVMVLEFGVRDRKVKSRDCALASDLVRATPTRGLRARPPEVPARSVRKHLVR